MTGSASSSTAAATAQLPFEHVDVLVVGAGISGIDAGYHLKNFQPGRSFAIVDSRDAIGGTWDLFKYPGLRSDSDMHSFGFGFKPWTRDNAVADAHEILAYMQEAIDENDLQRHIHLGHKVVRADFSTADERWSVTLERASDGVRFDVTASVLFSAAGYYDGDEGFTPDFPGRAEFGGTIVHPQHWPEDLDYTGKKVVVIGSGATAVTLLPAMSDTAGHVTMLQRSPSYVLSIPRQDPIANTFRKVLPEKLAYETTRKFNIRKATLIYKGSKRFPKQVRKLFRSMTVKALPEGYDVDTHFNPEYNPWDQRICMVPDGDMFKAISEGRASVVTDRISQFTKSGILLESGTELEADIIITATGLKMVPFGKMSLAVDGKDVHVPEHVAYKSVMLSDVPNFAFTVGYVNGTWTPKADLAANWLCRLLAHMDENGYSMATPVVTDKSMPVKQFIDFDAGYVSRAMGVWPRQGTAGSWAAPQDVDHDRQVLGKDPIADPELRFTAARLSAPTLVTAGVTAGE